MVVVWRVVNVRNLPMQILMGYLSDGCHYHPSTTTAGDLEVSLKSSQVKSSLFVSSCIEELLSAKYRQRLGFLFFS